MKWGCNVCVTRAWLLVLALTATALAPSNTGVATTQSTAIAELQNEINSLLAEVQSLQAKLAAVVGNATP